MSLKLRFPSIKPNGGELSRDESKPVKGFIAQFSGPPQRPTGEKPRLMPRLIPESDDDEEDEIYLLRDEPGLMPPPKAPSQEETNLARRQRDVSPRKLHGLGSRLRGRSSLPLSFH